MNRVVSGSLRDPLLFSSFLCVDLFPSIPEIQVLVGARFSVIASFLAQSSDFPCDGFQVSR
jgi:hypothetical protein